MLSRSCYRNQDTSRSRLIGPKRVRSHRSVVTDRRLVFAEQSYRDNSFTEVTSIPRAAVLAARREGRFLQRGRVVMDFADLSRIALRTGILFTGAARRLVSAVNDGPDRADG